MPGRAERTELTPEEVKQAMEEGKSRGLPPGWTVKLDVSKHGVCDYDGLCRLIDNLPSLTIQIETKTA
jgi:hypothetical protein